MSEATKHGYRDHIDRYLIPSLGRRANRHDGERHLPASEDLGASADRPSPPAAMIRSAPAARRAARRPKLVAVGCGVPI